MATDGSPLPAHPETLRLAGWVVLAGYAALLALTGYFASRIRARSASAYFLAGRHMPVWAIAISMLATVQSAATFVGVPEQAFGGNLAYLSTNIGGVAAAIIIAYCFIPAYYRLGVSTPYQLLEHRFGPGAKVAASCAYMVGRIFASGARIYVGALPVAIAFFGDAKPSSLAWIILAFMVFAVLFTLRGGLESVIWTDIVQVCVYMGAAVVLLVLLWRAIPTDVGSVWDALRGGGDGGTSKLALVTKGTMAHAPYIDFAKPFTLLTAITGWTLLMLGALGTDQDLTQRLLTCRNARDGARSTIVSVLIGIPAVVLFSCIGLLLWVVATRPDLMQRATPPSLTGASTDILLRFVLSRDNPAWIGGLVIAGVLAAGPAGINASLNSMAGTFVQDLYKPLLVPGREEAHYVRVSKLAVCAWGLVLGAFAVVCIGWKQSSGEDIITFVLGVMTFAYAGMLAVFLTALFTSRGTTTSCILAMLTGFGVVLALQPSVLRWCADHMGQELVPFEILIVAPPWRLVVGTLLATAVCVLPKGRGIGIRRESSLDVTSSVAKQSLTDDQPVIASAAQVVSSGVGAARNDHWSPTASKQGHQP